MVRMFVVRERGKYRTMYLMYFDSKVIPCAWLTILDDDYAEINEVEKKVGLTLSIAPLFRDIDKTADALEEMIEVLKRIIRWMREEKLAEVSDE